MSIVELQNQIKTYLTTELERRCQTNPQYSLRAFAKSLSIDSSYLSKILNGKRSLSEKGVLSLAEKLDFPDEITQDLRRLSRRTTFTCLDVDQFRIIADWYHYAILEMTRLEDFRPDVKWIAEHLGISFGESLAAVERLKRCGLLVDDAMGNWKAQSNTTIRHKFSNAAFRQMQKQILLQAIAAMENIPLEKRDQSSITMCIDSSRLPAAKEKLKAFRRDLMEFLENGPKKDAVYQLSLSLFPVAQTSSQGETTQ
jgi:uncharacterized protein (TIGR02147 family)